MAVTREQARKAKEKAKALLAEVPGVNGIGISRLGPDYALKVNLAAALSDAIPLPDRIDGVPVLVFVVGRIHKR